MKHELKILETLIKDYTTINKKPNEAKMMNTIVWNYYKKTNKIMNAELYDKARCKYKK